MDMRRVLESERSVERDFVAGDRADPKGWSVALTMYHFLKWRERIHDAFTSLREGRPHTPAPQNIDELNDGELASAAHHPLAESARRADSLIASLIDLYDAVGDQPFEWYRWRTTTEALLGSTYIHPHTHMVEYLRENDDLAGAVRLMKRTVSELRGASAPDSILGVEIFNLACLRVFEGRHDDALALLEESVAKAPRLKDHVPGDPDFAPLYDDERFRLIVGVGQSER